MSGWLNGLASLMKDRPAEHLIGLLMAALMIAAAAGGLIQWTRRTKADPLACAVGVVLVANLVAMLVAASYLLPPAANPGRRGPDERPNWPPPPGAFVGGPRSGMMAGRILEAADADGDGRLSTEEATTAAGAFLRELQGDHADGVDQDALAQAIRDRLFRP